MKKLLLYSLILIDIIAFLALTSFGSCLQGESVNCAQSISSPVSWFVIVIATLSTSFYLYKRKKEGLALLPFGFNLLGKSDIPWSYSVYYFLALIFWGENIPEIVGHLKGLPLGAPGTHASLMNPELFFRGNSGTAINLVIFFVIAFAVTVAFKKLNVLGGLILSVSVGVFFEYITKLGKPAEIPEGFDIYNHLWATLFNFVIIWAMLIFVPFLIFKLFTKVWKENSVWILVVLLIILNIASYFFFLYELKVKKNVLPGYFGNNAQVLPSRTCPDQMVLDSGKVIAYKDGQEVQFQNQSDRDWIQQNCPITEKSRLKTK